MSNPDNGTAKGSVKTLAIRLEPELHAQLSLIAQLRDSTITDEIRQAIEAHIVSVKSAPELAARADGVLEDIEREAVARRAAIATLFGETPDSEPATSPTPISRPRGGRKAGGEA
jgi:predicted DNA-binding protein